MEIIKKEKMLCSCCMEEHEVEYVRFNSQEIFKGKEVDFVTEACRCEAADSLFETEEQINANDRRMKEAYKKASRLLSADEIVAIRERYTISQTDLCILLGWGEKTIARYESGYQVQDRAHDIILRKLSEDPEWFICLLKNAEKNIAVKAYNKYLQQAISLYQKEIGYYERKVFQARKLGTAFA